jgi:hypothetical protein
MVCYQVFVRFTFRQHKAVLVSTTIKKQNAPAFLAASALPFGSPCKHRRWFATKKEAALYVAYLHKVYANRTAPGPAHSGDQLELF